MNQSTIPCTEVKGVTFNLAAWVATDLRGYIGHEAEPDRLVVIYLMGPTKLSYLGSDADAAYQWYLQFTGQSRITVPTLKSVT